MTPIVWFRLAVLFLLVAVGAFASLFVSFLFPGAFVSDEPTVRLARHSPA